MKKLLTAMSIFAISTAAFAGFQGNTQSTQELNVAAVKRAADDSYVTLRGNIVEKVGKEKYTFKDNTGSIQVEIDDDVWGGLNVTPDMPVTISGEVDHEKGRIEIDVKTISK